jgi:hypothetical protein
VNAHHFTSPREATPTRIQAVVFALKASVFRLRRWLRDPAGVRPFPLQGRSIATNAPQLTESRTPLHSSDASAEFALQAGKIQNLRVAARSLHGLMLRRGELFSFWANVPRPTKRQGFTEGRELREGCVIPSIGGGLCQLSNALYDLALRTGCEIVERHAHSRQLPGSQAAAGRDATVFWNYVDLRFRAPCEMQLAVSIEARELVVTLHVLDDSGARQQDILEPAVVPSLHPETVESCETCGATECFRNPVAATLTQEGHTAWLVDAFVPEFDSWMSKHCHASDWLLLPLDSRRFHCGGYRWNTAGFSALREARWTVLRRSWVSRRLAEQGAARQRALLAMDEALADAFARQLPPAATHLVVSQNLLPFLWRRGDLGGRTFDVLMTRLPLAELERVLDEAAARLPESPTLADFRAPTAIVEAETAALAEARHWITPHSSIAKLARTKAVKLDWRVPAVRTSTPGEWIVFPASTLARKGAWELRVVARELDLPVRLGGPVLEAPAFWSGIRTEPAGVASLDGARAVVLPAWIEHQPRRLLQAVAAGVPVIASDACGLGGLAGVTTVPAGDVDALRTALGAVLSRETVPLSR